MNPASFINVVAAFFNLAMWLAFDWTVSLICAGVSSLVAFYFWRTDPQRHIREEPPDDRMPVR